MTSFVRNIAAQVQEQISSNNDTRASNLSFIGQLSMSDDGSVEILDESEDELFVSRVKAGEFANVLAHTPPRSLCSTTSTSSLISRDWEEGSYSSGNLPYH